MRRSVSVGGLLLVVACAGRPAPSSSPAPVAKAGAAKCCTRDDMHTDLQALQSFVEDSHPDPYLRSGDKDRFRARFAAAEAALPEAGMNADAFYARLRPLLAQIHDGHTSLRAPEYSDDPKVLLGLDVVEERLVVRAVHDPALRSAIGAEVVAVDGVPMATLAQRMGERRGYENVYGNLRHVVSALGYASTLADLTERPNATRVRFDLNASDGHARAIEVPMASIASGVPAALEAPTRVKLPEPDASAIASGFLDPAGHTAVIRIDSAMRYREAFEVWRATGYFRNLGTHLNEVYTAATGHAPGPDVDVDHRIIAVPSLTERLVGLFGQMKAKETRTLVVDLRDNEGGNSVFATILEYFLYPLDTMVAVNDGYQVPRYSKLYFENHRTDSIEKLRARTGRPSLALGDKDPSAEERWRASNGKPMSAEERARRIAELGGELKALPTFDRVFAERKWNATWKPRVVVLTSARTYSAGFDAVLRLRAHGAKIAGVPSAQAANCFIDTLGFELPRSHLRGSVSYKWSVRLPDEPQQGELLRPDAELTYAAFAASGFDPNAAYSLLEALR